MHKNNLSKIALAFLLLILLTNISLAIENIEYDNTNNTILNETSLNFPVNLTIFEITGTITDKENNTKGNFSHYLIGFEFLENDTTTYIPFEELMIIVNSSGIFNYTYYYADGKLVARRDNNNNIFYYHSDHLGSTTLVTNQSGSIVEEEFYLPFGDIYSGVESSRHLYTGKEQDKGTELYYYGVRYYNPFSKQFIQPDSIISDIYNPQALNRYSYVLNNPYKYVDPNGLWAVQINFGAGITFLGAGVGASISIGPVFSYSKEYGFQATLGGSAGGGASLGGIGKLNIGIGFSKEAQQVSDVAGRASTTGIAGAYGHGAGYSYSEEEGGISTHTVSYNPGVGFEIQQYEVETGILPWKIQIGGRKGESGVKIEEDDFDTLEKSDNSFDDYYDQYYLRSFGTTQAPGSDGVIYAYDPAIRSRKTSGAIGPKASSGKEMNKGGCASEHKCF